MSFIDLKKKAGITLAKRNVPKVIARVGLAIDISGSMQSMYRTGTVQEVVEKILALAAQFDDDGAMDVWTFDNGVTRYPSVTESGFGGYVQREILSSNNDKWGGTSFGPALSSITEEYFGKSFVEKISGGFFGMFRKKELDKVAGNDEPAILIFITDGQNDDPDQTRKILESLQNKNIYFQFVGIGGSSSYFTFLQKVADDYPNTGFFAISDIRTIKDEALFEGLVSEELATWLKQI